MILQHAQLLIEVPADVQKSYLENLQVQAHIFNTRNVPTKSFWKKITNTDLKRIYLMKLTVGEAHLTLSTKVHQMFWQKFPCPKLLSSATIPKQLISELSEVFGTLDVIKGSVLKNNIILGLQET